MHQRLILLINFFKNLLKIPIGILEFIVDLLVFIIQINYSSLKKKKTINFMLFVLYGKMINSTNIIK